MLSSSVLVMY